jgi:hypothetical protein
MESGRGMVETLLEMSGKSTQAVREKRIATWGKRKTGEWKTKE